MEISSKRQGFIQNKKTRFYEITKKETFAIIVNGILLLILFSYFFYRTVWSIIPLMPLFFLFQKFKKVEIYKKKKEELKQQFQEVMGVVSRNMKAGNSAENAFVSSYEDMCCSYGGTSSISKMLNYIKSGLENNVSLEYRMQEVGKRSNIAEIEEFASVFAISKISGGNMTEIMERTAAIIGEKIETDREIAVLLSARKMEQKIMNAVPFFILAYLDITSPGFFDILYHNMLGTIVMSICLILYVAAYGISTKMIAIEI